MYLNASTEVKISIFWRKMGKRREAGFESQEKDLLVFYRTNLYNLMYYKPDYYH